MITQDQIGPKLQPIDHSCDENQFLETKKDVGSFVFDDVIDHPYKYHPNSQLDPLKEEEKLSFFQKFPTDKRQNFIYRLWI